MAALDNRCPSCRNFRFVHYKYAVAYTINQVFAAGIRLGTPRIEIELCLAAGQVLTHRGSGTWRSKSLLEGG